MSPSGCSDLHGVNPIKTNKQTNKQTNKNRNDSLPQVFCIWTAGGSKPS